MSAIGFVALIAVVWMSKPKQGGGGSGSDSSTAADAGGAH